MKKTYRVKRQTARNRDALLKVEYTVVNVSKVCNEMTKELIGEIVNGIQLSNRKMVIETAVAELRKRIKESEVEK